MNNPRTNSILEGLYRQRVVEAEVGIEDTDTDVDIKDFAVEDLRVYKKDSKNAVCVFTFEKNIYMQGFDEGKPINLPLNTDPDSVLVEQGYVLQELSKEELDKYYNQYSTASGDASSSDTVAVPTSESIFEPYKGEKVIFEDTADKVGTAAIKVGVGSVVLAGVGALTKVIAGQSMLAATLFNAGSKGKVVGSYLFAKACSNIPMSAFGYTALAGVGVVAAVLTVAVIHDKVIKNRSKKEEKEAEDAKAKAEEEKNNTSGDKGNTEKGSGKEKNEVKAGAKPYRTAWGKYYTSKAGKWVEVEKKDYEKVRDSFAK